MCEQFLYAIQILKRNMPKKLLNQGQNPYREIQNYEVNVKKT